MFEKNQNFKLKEDEKVILTDEEMANIVCDGATEVNRDFIENLGKKK